MTQAGPARESRPSLGLFPVVEGVYGLDLNLLGLPCYGACYVVRGTQAVALVEVGTSHAVSRILEGLDLLGIPCEAVRFIVCTHVHLDHAGAAGELARRMPNAQVVIHSRSHRHLADTTRLLAGVAEAVGPLFPLYGTVIPVPPERLLPAEEAQLDLGGGVRLVALPTPGHSRDHVAYEAPHAGLLFTGDAAGVSLLGHSLVRPVTVPPAFEPEAMLQSLERLRARRPRALCFTHYGVSWEPEGVFDRLEALLRDWDVLAHTAGPHVAAEAVYRANLPPDGTDSPEIWHRIAEMNRSGFLRAYTRGS
ncbi:MAG: MBL fold metallo-hydrolase [Chloroflexia bacterium]